MHDKKKRISSTNNKNFHSLTVQMVGKLRKENDECKEFWPSGGSVQYKVRNYQPRFTMTP